MFGGNDSVIIETRVVTYPAELMYDDGTNDYSWSWAGGGGGLGNKFLPPRYPCRITGAKAYLLAATPPVACTIYVFAANGPGGIPGTVLGQGYISVTSATATWYQITLNQTLASGNFYVGTIANTGQALAMCTDSSFPRSGQGMEYTGVWAPFRSSDLYDPMMRALVDLGAGVEELLPIRISTPRIEFKAYPNPFSNNTKIMLNGKVNQFSIVKIYNALGEQVNKLSTHNDYLLWNGTDDSGRKLNPGIYFARLETENGLVTKILISD
jgi:hypothetical protein